MKALILAAGYGTRLRPYTEHTPKPLFTVAGRPLLDIIIGQLQEAGCKAVIVNTHHLHHKIEAFLRSQTYGIEVLTRYEPQILGTGGAIKNVADFWDEQPFMVINADIVADIDLKTVYEVHCRHHPPATLVLCDNPVFNSVAVRQNKWITGFYNVTQSEIMPPDNLLTFTGIQVLEPQILNYIPENAFYSSIDAFKKILAEGRQIGAIVTPKNRWRDIGTPQSYRQVAINTASAKAFQRAFATPPARRIHREKLKGDGSERQWYRLKADHQSIIMVDHGIRQTAMTSELDSFVHLGRHLFQRGVPVPEIYYYDTFSGLVFLEDLGDVHLQQTVRSKKTSAVAAIYEPVIDQLIRLSCNGADKFDRNWTYQTSDYNRELILEKECRYFLEAFLNDFLNFKERYDDFQTDFNALADKALQTPITGFMHRDMQSRNIMIKGRKIYFIDFQGGRLGPIQYDLASLLIDPYVEIPPDVQADLLDYCIEALSAVTEVDSEKFRSCYHYCRLTRNLQILGAFAYLSKVKGKRQFENYMPAAVRSLRSTLAAGAQGEFPALEAITRKIYSQMKIN
ncbi:MAG: sugar phosphate nucleotidyltransferase [Desulfobacterales bacterium]|jgi:NDP-sugar pyrophosphorylase family protein